MTSNFFSLLPPGHYIFYLDVSLIEASFCIASKKYLRPQFVKIASQRRRTYIIKGCALFLSVILSRKGKMVGGRFLGKWKIWRTREKQDNNNNKSGFWKRPRPNRRTSRENSYRTRKANSDSWLHSNRNGLFSEKRVGGLWTKCTLLGQTLIPPL